MKLFELAKELGLKATEVQEKLLAHGHDIKSANTKLSKEQLDIFKSQEDIVSQEKNSSKFRNVIISKNQESYVVSMVDIEDNKVVSVVSSRNFPNKHQAFYELNRLIGELELDHY